MLIKTRGIIIRCIRYSETSFIADVYTEEKGLRTYIVSGVRTKNSKTSAGLLQIMSLVKLVAYERDSKSIQRIKELSADHVYHSIPFDVKKASVGMFMAELVSRTVREIEVNKPLFQFLYDSFESLDNTQDTIANWHLRFMIELTAFLGFMPSNDTAGLETYYFDLKEGIFTDHKPAHPYYLDKENSALLHSLMNKRIEESHLTVMQRSNRADILEALITYYRLHVEQFDDLNSRHILHEVLG